MTSRVRRYIINLFDHKLDISTKTLSVLMKVQNLDNPYGDVFGSEGDRDPTAGQLTYDDSVQPNRKHLMKVKNRSKDEVRLVWWVSGIEMISPVLGWNDPIYLDLDSSRLTKTSVRKIDTEAYFTDEEGRHAHISLTEFPITLRVAQNVMVLYGLWENEIEQWLNPERRNTPWCKRIRCGMEQMDQNQNIVARTKGLRHTPQKYTELMYATRDGDSLRKVVSGQTDTMGRKTVQVYFSPRKSYKPATFEFRQHKGTIDHIEIKWWVLFCGYLVRHAILMEQTQVRLLNSDHPEAGIRYVEQVTQHSILDKIAFPKEGTTFFRLRAIQNRDNEFGRKEHVLVYQVNLVVRLGNGSFLVSEYNTYNAA